MGIPGIFFVRYSDLKGWQRIALKGALDALDKLTIGLSLASFYVAAYLGTTERRWSLAEVGLAAWAVTELLFRMYVYLRIARADKCRPAPLAGYERVALAKKMNDHMQEIKELQEWFEPMESMTKDALNSFVIGIFFGKDEDELTKEEESQAEEIKAIYEGRGEELLDRPSKKAKVLSLNSQAIMYEMRSVIYYGMVGAVRFLGELGLHRHGIKWYSLKGDLSYWLHQPPNPDPDQVPILYFHGIGVGPCIMLQHITSLMEAYPRRPIILFSLPHISLVPFAKVASEDDAIEAIDMLFQQLGLNRVSIVAHSFGTLTAAWMIKTRPLYVSQITLIDPVCYMLWSRYLLRRACHDSPDTVIHHYVRRFISRNHNFAIAIWRTMYWPYSFQMIEDLPCPTAIFLAKRDWAIDAPTTYSYLMRQKAISHLNNVTIQMNDIDHLEFLAHQPILDHINLHI
ncbi:hypothetical protein DSO57_1016770 [Entomophthora muscae]|uniref:Uncharacterized protein n=1 Tax=Entomophthora muscae TaxID=34485 RepID=A0ACC2T4N0_9FUNG|nr:hypothetical protein DSO57_1016770 [Entomophthora muscae]